jgi:hypothetical protein
MNCSLLCTFAVCGGDYSSGGAATLGKVNASLRAPICGMAA